MLTSWTLEERVLSADDLSAEHECGDQHQLRQLPLPLSPAPHPAPAQLLSLLLVRWHLRRNARATGHPENHLKHKEKKYVTINLGTYDQQSVNQ